MGGGTAVYHMDGLLRWPMSDSEPRGMAPESLFYARPFLNRQEDLDLDFSRLPRPVLITRLLADCIAQDDGTRFTEDEIWQWSLKKRLQALLAIVVATSGRYLLINDSCGHEECHETMEIDVDLSAFQDNWEIDTFPSRPRPDSLLQIRLPRGIDQLQWLDKGQVSVDNDHWFAEMATDLVTSINGQKPEHDWRVPLDWIEKIGADLEDNDALMSLQLSTICPFCRQACVIAIDLEDRLLAVLGAMQKQMFLHIHSLASSYHWSEMEIMALSSRRRNYYLQQIEEGLAE